MTEVEVVTRAATLADAEDLAPRMRAADVAEVFASSSRGPRAVLQDCLAKSLEAYTTLFDGEVTSMWGVAPAPDPPVGVKVGVVWLLSSATIERHRAAFLAAASRALLELLSRWDVLINAIDVRHVKAIRWAERCGFQLDEPAPYGPFNLPFRPFWVSKEVLRV